MGTFPAEDVAALLMAHQLKATYKRDGTIAWTCKSAGCRFEVEADREVRAQRVEAEHQAEVLLGTLASVGLEPDERNHHG